MNRPLLWSVTFILVTISCKKQVVSNDEPHITNPTSYVLTRITWSGPTTNGESMLFIYNSDHLISRVERYNWGTFSTNGGPIQKWYDTSYTTFEYKDGLCYKTNTIKDFGRAHRLYEYNARKLLVKATTYNFGGQLQDYTYYKYDDKDNLIEKSRVSNQTTAYRWEYSYDERRNMTREVAYALWSNPQTKTQSEWSQFDDKIKYTRAVNGLPIDWTFHPNSVSPNNDRQRHYYSQVNITEPFSQPHETFSTYEYDSAGLPIRQYSGSWIVTYEYEKYK